MYLSRTAALCGFCLAAILPLGQRSHAQSSSDLISLSTSIAASSTSPGSTNEGSCNAFNNVNESVRVTLDAQVVYPDGAVVRLEKGRPLLLEPGQGTAVFILFVVPEGTSLGTATFQCAARAISGSDHEQEMGAATFEVVAP